LFSHRVTGVLLCLLLNLLLTQLWSENLTAVVYQHPASDLSVPYPLDSHRLCVVSNRWRQNRCLAGDYGAVKGTTLDVGWNCNALPTSLEVPCMISD
jgi:hypothetical protein